MSETPSVPQQSVDMAVILKNLPRGSISTNKLVDGAVTTEKLADGTTTTGILSENLVTSDTIGDETITQNDLTQGSIIAPIIAPPLPVWKT